LLYVVGTALLLGSWYGLLLGLVLTGMLAWRAIMEERMLREGLEGYDAYMIRVNTALSLTSGDGIDLLITTRQYNQDTAYGYGFR
jgi:hypothetical protein